jgi:DNA-binding response OmpR family regulator
MLPRQKRVLCVEDDPSSAELLAAILHDHKVINAGSVTEAVEFIREEIFDYIILDQNLPDGAGIELFNRIRLIDKRVPIIFVTGAENFECGPAGNCGCDGIIRKGSPDFYDRVLAFVDRDRPPSDWNIVS